MREQLIQYVNLLFAGAPNSEEIKQEILQNTLDRYDDLVSQGKTPEAAYRLAISGIGDVNEILGAQSTEPVMRAPVQDIQDDAQEKQNKKFRAVAVAMYILCPIPLFILSEFGLATMGLCFTLLLVAAATALIVMIKEKEPENEERAEAQENHPATQLKKSVGALIWAIGLVLYFVVSFLTNAWYATWLMFPIIGCVQGLSNAIIDLKEASKHEK